MIPLLLRRCWSIASLIVVALLLLLLVVVVVDNFSSSPRRLQEQQQTSDAAAALIKDEYHALAQHLCPLEDETITSSTPSSSYPLLPYHACNPNATLDVIPFFGGMTNGLKFIILGSLTSFQHNKCFIITEQNSHLHPGFANHSNTDILSPQTGFNSRYFETIGLPHDDPLVVNAVASGRYKIRKWEEYWYDGWSRKMKFLKFNSEKLGYKDIDGHSLKRNYLHRLWRLKPEVRDQTCQILRDDKMKVPLDGTFFTAYSVRRGDKNGGDMRTNLLPPMELYINVTQVVLKAKNIPVDQVTIFVATDDCTVLKELRDLRPSWNFVSACQDSEIEGSNKGFHLTDVSQWTAAQRDEHFIKFFVELYALALAPLFVGVSYTNVAWWVYFMKPVHLVDRDFILLDLIAGGNDKKGEFLRSW